MNKRTDQRVDIAKPLPHNPEAEASVLGAILIDNSVVEEVGFLRVEDFYSLSNQIIYRTMLELRKDFEPIDIVTLHERLQNSGELASAGGAQHVASLANGIPKAFNAKPYARIVYDKSVLRGTIRIANLGMEMAFGKNFSAEQIIESVLQGFMDLSMRRATDTMETKNFKEASVEQLSKSNDDTILRIKTGIEKLDEQTGGFRAGELITITAGTGVGKTFLAQQTRRYSCECGLHSLYCSAEMPAGQLVARELATIAEVPHWKMRQPERWTPEEYSRLVAAAAHECIHCSILDGELSLRRIWMKAHALKRTTGLHCVIIDYDELVDAPGKDEFAQQKNLIRGSKSLAISLGCPVIMISQLRKPLDAKDAKKPRIEQLYGSGAKSKHSSFVLFVDREYVRELKGDETKARICILKSREGRIGEIPARFNLTTLRFEGADPETPAQKKVKKHHMDEQQEE